MGRRLYLMATIGERLTALRENKSLTQAQVAEIIGVDRASYAKYEANVNKPTRKLKDLEHRKSPPRRAGFL
jgi:transcriptional regulator with XRE-family HTH domain